MQNFDRASLLSAIESLETERVNIQAAQIDPRTDPDSIYMLLAGVENLERLLGDKTTTTFDPTAHKLGVLSQGLILINEIHRLPLRLLESLMGFLEEAGTLRYSISGRMLTIDGAIIFTANSSLRQLGEDITPIVSRIPMVLWPARSLEERREIVRDIFQEHNRRASSPLGYSILGTLSPQQESSIFVSRLVIELLARVASLSFPEALFLTTRPREFLRALETTQSIPKAPFFDTRSLYQFIGKLLLSRERIETMNPVVIEHVLPSLSDLGFIDETGKAIYEIKDLVTETILGFSTDQLSIEAIERERRILDRRIEESEEFEKAVLRAEGLESAVKRIPKTIIEQLRESYMHILEDH